MTVHSNRLVQKKNNIVTGVDIVDGKIVFGRYDGSQLEVPASPNNWMQLTANGINLVHNDDVPLPWAANNDPPPVGTGIEWDVAAPTVVTVGVDGAFDVSFECQVNAGSSICRVTAHVQLNDDSAGPLYDWYPTVVADPAWGGPMGGNPTVGAFIPGVRLSAGDELVLIVNQQGNVSDDVMVYNNVMAINQVG